MIEGELLRKLVRRVKVNQDTSLLGIPGLPSSEMYIVVYGFFTNEGKFVKYSNFLMFNFFGL